jgi:Chaperone of endosialidase
MADASRRLLQLRPVTFRYTQAYGDGSKPLQFGLIAEEVEEVFPELVVQNAEGQPEAVHYETLNVLLLNELQKQHDELTEERQARELQQQRLDVLERQGK